MVELSQMEKFRVFISIWIWIIPSVISTVQDDQLIILRNEILELKKDQQSNRNAIENLEMENEEMMKQIRDVEALCVSSKTENYSPPSIQQDSASTSDQEELMRKVGSSVEEMRKSLELLLEKHQSLQNHPTQSYDNLATELEEVRFDISSIHLLEEARRPRLRKMLSHYDADISRLRNLTGRLDEELIQIQAKRENEPVCSSLQDRISALENDTSRLIPLFENPDSIFNSLDDRVRSLMVSMIRRGTKNDTPKTDILNFTDEIEEIFGSGESSGDFPISTDGSRGFESQFESIENDLSNLTSRLAEAMLKSQEQMSRKADRVQVDEITAFFRGESKAIERSLEKLEKRVKFGAEMTQQSLDQIEANSEQMKEKAERAEMVAEVVKKVQSRHYGELQGFKGELNRMETNVLRFGLKLTTLQADFLNSSLRLYQGSAKDHQQDLSLARSSIKLGALEKSIDAINSNLKAMEGNLDDRVSYEEWKTTQSYVEAIHDKLSSNFQLFHRTNITLTRIDTALSRLERTIPSNCAEVFPVVSNISAQLVKANGMESRWVLCAPGGWTYIQRRGLGSPHFNQSWDSYSKGFGSIQGDFWTGNEFLHALTSSQTFQLAVDTWDIYDEYRTVEYGSFVVGPESGGYSLLLGASTRGNLSDSFSPFHNRMRFSTYDEDKDASNTHCAKYYGSGWWFAHCQKVNLNGNFHVGMTWFDNSTGDWIHLKRTALRIRPAKI